MARKSANGEKKPADGGSGRALVWQKTTGEDA
jgi:hypothetical protein